MDESLLERKWGIEDSETESCHWEEYWFEGSLVHRSVHLILRQPAESFASLGGA